MSSLALVLNVNQSNWGPNQTRYWHVQHELKSCISSRAASAQELLQLKSCFSSRAASAQELHQLKRSISLRAASAQELHQLKSCISSRAALAQELHQLHIKGCHKEFLAYCCKRSTLLNDCISLKWQCHKIFWHFFLHQSNPPGPLILLKDSFSWRYQRNK